MRHSWDIVHMNTFHARTHKISILANHNSAIFFLATFDTHLAFCTFYLNWLNDAQMEPIRQHRGTCKKPPPQWIILLSQWSSILTIILCHSFHSVYLTCWRRSMSGSMFRFMCPSNTYSTKYCRHAELPLSIHIPFQELYLFKWKNLILWSLNVLKKISWYIFRNFLVGSSMKSVQVNHLTVCSSGRKQIVCASGWQSSFQFYVNILFISVHKFESHPFWNGHYWDFMVTYRLCGKKFIRVCPLRRHIKWWRSLHIFNV